MPALAHLQSSFVESDWLPLDEAAPLLAEPLRTLRWRCRSSLAKQYLARLASPRDGNGKPTWWLHRSIDPRLCRAPDALTRYDLERPTLLQQYPEHRIQRAYLKAHWVAAWRKTLDGPRGEETDLDITRAIVSEAKRIHGEDFPISPRSLQIWRSSMLSLGQDGKSLGVHGLIDRYGRPSALPGEDPRAVSTSRSPEAIAFFYEQYRSTLGLSLKHCHRITRNASAGKHWQWPASYSATRVWLDRTDDLPLTCICREGKKAWTKKYMSYLEQDWEAVNVGQLFVADHHQCDFWVSYKHGQLRPWLTAIQDCRSRRIVGWNLGPAPHQDAILQALRRAFGEAIPEYLRIDNGRDFKSAPITGLTPQTVQRLRAEFGDGVDSRLKWWNAGVCDDGRWGGVAAELGVKLIFALPYSPWSKGTLERFFGTFADNVSRTFATYTGNSTDTRPECVQLIREGYTGRGQEGLELCDGSAVPIMRAARESITAWLTIYDHTPHFGVGIDGQTPIAVWRSAPSLRQAEEKALDFLLTIRGSVKVGPNGVSVQIGGKRWSFGARSNALRPWMGRKVLVGHDPTSPTRVIVFDPATRHLIAALEPNERVNPLADIETMREKAAEINRDRKIMRGAEKASARRTLSAAQRVNRELHVEAERLRATGTDGRPPDANIQPVRTGFEGVSIPVQRPVDRDLPTREQLSALFIEESEDDAVGPAPYDPSDLFMPIFNTSKS